jgi:hypothetical protein
MRLQLIVSNEWTMLPKASTQGHEIYHKEYGGQIHGLVFVDENGQGNATIMDSDDNCLALHETPVTCFESLKIACDKIFNDFKLQVGAM